MKQEERERERERAKMRKEGPDVLREVRKRKGSWRVV